MFREVTATVEHRPDELRGVSMLLLYTWPSGVYIDPYELASQRGQNDWRVTMMELCINIKA